MIRPNPTLIPKVTFLKAALPHTQWCGGVEYCVATAGCLSICPRVAKCNKLVLQNINERVPGTRSLPSFLSKKTKPTYLD